MNQIKVPIISQDLRQDEVCIRAIKTFEYLDKSLDEVFSKIDERIASLTTRADEYNKRIKVASTTIEALKGSKKALRMYSPQKYPDKHENKFRPILIDKIPEIDFNYNIRSGVSLEEKKCSDKLQFFHLKRARIPTPQKPSLVMSTKSINSLITFVNNENILINDPTPKQRQRVDVSLAAEENDTTDFSRFSNLIKHKHEADNFHYFPNMNQAPDIELPMDLPELPGIADDITFTSTNQELIVPSLARMNIINELPNIDDLIEAETNKKLQEMNAQDLSKAPSVEQKEATTAPKPPAMPMNIPPPPPVPPSFVAPLPPPIPKPVEPEQKQQQTLPQVPDMRSSLMQAIRSAGGKAKLRSIPAADEQLETVKKKPQAAPAGDLMSDLHAKLALRRRGIAGSKEAKKEKSSIMDKVSKMIPPPTSDSESSSKSEDDWE